jgi:uncharacterized protein YkwD
MKSYNLIWICIAGICSILLLCCRDDDSPEEILKRKMLIEINRIRLSGCSCGNDTLPPTQVVAWSDDLTSAAKRHTLDMSTKNFLNHVGSDGSTPANRASEAGFQGTYIGENIARGYRSVDEVILGWKSSEAHCKNIMNYHYKYMGVATIDYYWTLVLGSE